MRQNSVGYQEIEVPAGFSLFTVTFDPVAGGNYDIQDVEVYTNGVKVVLPKSSDPAVVTMQKMDTEGTYVTSQLYGWRTRTQGTGWYKGTAWQARGNVTFVNGEAVCLNNKLGVPAKLRVCGEVNLEPWSAMIAPGFNLVGNMTPATIDLQDVEVYTNGVKVVLGKASDPAVVTIQMMDSEGTYITSQLYGWRTRTQGTGWYKGTAWQARGNVTLLPGQSGCLNNKLEVPILLKYKSPIAPAEAD